MRRRCGFILALMQCFRIWALVHGHPIHNSGALEMLGRQTTLPMARSYQLKKCDLHVLFFLPCSKHVSIADELAVECFKGHLPHMFASSAWSVSMPNDAAALVQDADSRTHSDVLRSSVEETLEFTWRSLWSCQLWTYTPGDWVKVFEVRFLVRTQQHRQRLPQATHSLLARVSSDVLASAVLCIVSDHVRDCPFSLDSRPSCIGCSAWFLVPIPPHNPPHHPFLQTQGRGASSSTGNPGGVHERNGSGK